MITDLQVRTDYGRVDDPMILVDVPGEYYVLEVTGEQARLLYRSERMDEVNDRGGFVAVSVYFGSDELREVYNMSLVIEKIILHLKKQDALHYKRLAKIAETDMIEQFIERRNRELIRGAVPPIGQDDAVFCPPVKVDVSKVDDVMVYLEDDTSPLPERLALACHAVQNGAGSVAIPIGEDSYFLESLADSCEVLVGRKKAIQFASTKPVPLWTRLLRRAKRQTEESKELTINPADLIRLPREVLTLSEEVYELAITHQVTASSIYAARARMVEVCTATNDDDRSWETKRNDVLACLLMLGDQLRHFVFTAEDSRLELGFKGEDHCFYSDQEIGLLCKESTIDEARHRIDMLPYLRGILVEGLFGSVEVVFNDDE